MDQALGEVQDLDEETDLQPGDLLFGIGTTNEFHREITKLDGYWCHAMMFVGAGEVAESSLNGWGTAELLELQERYDGGLALARPAFPPEVREDAAGVARDWADDGRGRYDHTGAGLLWALLVRAGLDADQILEELDGRTGGSGVARMAEPSSFRLTCSAFVYQAYREAGAELTVQPASVFDYDGESLQLPDDGPMEFADPDAFPDEPQVHSLGSPRIRRGVLYAAYFLVEAGLFRSTREMPIDRAVTPGDLWCSPDMGARHFLGEAAERRAMAATRGCRDGGRPGPDDVT